MHATKNQPEGGECKEIAVMSGKYLKGISKNQCFAIIKIEKHYFLPIPGEITRCDKRILSTCLKKI